MSSHHHLNPLFGEIEHVHFLSKDIGALYLSKESSDVTLVVAGQKFYSHKIILAARSEYFRALLFGGLKESKQDEIELKAISLPAFKKLMKYIYTGRISIAGECYELILDVLGLAHQYGFVDLEAVILNYVKEILNVSNVHLINNAALLYQMEFLSKICFDYMNKHASEIDSTDLHKCSPGIL